MRLKILKIGAAALALIGGAIRLGLPPLLTRLASDPHLESAL